MSITVGKLGIIRLNGDHLTLLRTSCFVRDKFRCQDCDRYVSPFAPEWADSRAHMAHIVGRGAGGSDTLENVVTKCQACHGVGEHNPKSVKAKA